MLFEEEFAVEDYQQLPVTVYDYYEPGTNLVAIHHAHDVFLSDTDQIVTKYYLPVNSGTGKNV